MESPGQIPSPTRPQDPVSPSEHPLAPWSPASSPSPFLSLSILISIRLSIRLSHNPVPLTPPVPQSATAPGGRLTFRRSLIRPEARPPPSPPFPEPRGFRSPGNPGTCRLIHRRLLPHHTSADGSPALHFARPRHLRLHPGEPVPHHHSPSGTPAEGSPVEPIVNPETAGEPVIPGNDGSRIYSPRQLAPSQATAPRPAKAPPRPLSPGRSGADCATPRMGLSVPAASARSSASSLPGTMRSAHGRI